MVTAALLLLPVFSALAPDSPCPDFLLPRPQRVEIHAGACPLQVLEKGLQLSGPVQEARERLQERLAESFTRAGFRMDTPALLRESATYRLSAHLTRSRLNKLPKACRSEGYVLTITPKGLAIDAATERGLFYGMMTLEQLINAAKVRQNDTLPCLQIVDWPAFQIRGPHEDYGRNQLPTMDDHKRSIRTIAQFKGNTYFWFIEPDHFVYSFDPGMSTQYDRFTLDEIRELTAYARTRYIEVVPVVELMGHMEETLNQARYRHLSETGQGGSTLCPTSDEAFEFARTIIDELAPAFGGRYFHCGLDESQVGEGVQSAASIKEKGIEAVHADYYVKLNDAVKAHGKTMIMYTDVALIHDGILDLLPKDIIMMYWGYTPRPRYNGLDRVTAKGFPTLALSGLWDWQNLYPMYLLGCGNIDTLTAQAVDVGSLGVSTSAWGDGYRNSCGANLSEWNTYGFVYCNAIAWNPHPIPLETYSPAYALSFFGTDAPELGQALTLLAECQGDDPEAKSNARNVFQDPPKTSIGAMEKANEATMAFWTKLKQDAEAAHHHLATLTVLRNADYVRAIDIAAQTLVCSADMAFLYRDIAQTQNTQNFDAARFAASLRTIAARHAAMWKEYEQAWLATNRPLNLPYIHTTWTNAINDITAFAQELDGGKFPTK